MSDSECFILKKQNKTKQKHTWNQKNKLKNKNSHDVIRDMVSVAKWRAVILTASIVCQKRLFSFCCNLRFEKWVALQKSGLLVLNFRLVWCRTYCFMLHQSPSIEFKSRWYFECYKRLIVVLLYRPDRQNKIMRISFESLLSIHWIRSNFWTDGYWITRSRSS